MIELTVIATNLDGPWVFHSLLRHLRTTGFLVLNKHWSKGTAQALLLWKEEDK